MMKNDPMNLTVVHPEESSGSMLGLYLFSQPRIRAGSTIANTPINAKTLQKAREI